MFGYVTIQEAELKVKDFKKYKAYYCGLCQTLKKNYGSLGQITLTYDMTFAIVLLTSLYESETMMSKHRCKIHPVKKQMMLQNKITEYAADMNLILAYYHMKDDWIDEKKVSGFAGTCLLRHKVKKAVEKYPRQTKVIQKCLKELSVCEENNVMEIDRPAGCFGKLMEELFVYKKDIWEERLRKIGFYLGKFIYIMDAYDDLEKDKEKENYNPLLEMSKSADFEEKCKELLCMMIAESAAAFEQLPCISDIDILRNILYDGVWNRYHKIQNEKKKSEE